MTPTKFTAAHRKKLEEFRAGDRPLNRAIDAVLEELDSRPTGGSYRKLVRNLVNQHAPRIIPFGESREEE
jgi:hypothetical protein